MADRERKRDKALALLHESFNAADLSLQNFAASAKWACSV